jgi:streptogramin lyase
LNYLALLLVSLSLLSAACSRPPTQAAASQAPPPPVEYVATWGSHGAGPGQFAAPIAMASDGESIIYIADAATGFIHKFSPVGEPRLSFQDDRMDLHPSDIAVDAGAAIYVADARRGTVVIFFSDGMHHRALRPGALAGVRESLHIGVDAYGTIYVTAKNPFGVRRFSPALRLIGNWGRGPSRDAMVENPSALAIGPDGLVYISESGQPQIKVFDTQGAPQRTLSLPADAGEAQLSGIAVSAKYIFAVNATRPVVYVWSIDGTYRLTQDLSPWIPSADAAVARKVVATPAGDLLVLDPAASRVFRFRLHL